MSNIDSAVEAVRRIVDLAHESNIMLASLGFRRRISAIDIGGGMQPEPIEAISVDKSNMTRYANELRRFCPELWSDFELITEFGAWTNFHTGYAYSDVEYAFPRGDNHVAFVHLGGDMLMRDVYIKPRGMSFVTIDKMGKPLCKESRPLVATDLAGPLCFAGDYIGKGVQLPKLQEGDGLLMLNNGSNSYGLWSRHCSRSIPKVLSVDFSNREISEVSSRSNPFVKLPSEEEQSEQEWITRTDACL